MKKTLLATAVLALSSGSVSAAVVQDYSITYSDNTAGSAVPNTIQYCAAWSGDNCLFEQTGPAMSAAFGSGNEFRVMSNLGAAGGGEVSLTAELAPDPAIGTATGDVVWTDAAGVITKTNTDIVPTDASQAGLFQNAPFQTLPFGFEDNGIVVSTSNPLGTAGTITFDFANGIVAQWGGGYFALGEPTAGNQCTVVGSTEEGCGVTWTGTIDAAGNFDVYGEHRISPWEDSNRGTLATPIGFQGLVTQWNLQGNISAAGAPEIPVPAAVWLFGSGLLGLVGVARRRQAA